MMGWQAGLLSVGFIVGTIIQGLIVLNNPSYIFERWHGTLLVWAITAFCVVFNTFLAKRLPAIEGVVLVIHMLGLFAVIVPLWILSPRATAAEALLTFTNGGGWPTTGLSAMIGLLTPMGSLCGFDCAVHMCSCSTSLIFSIYTNAKLSGRSGGRWPNGPKIHHVVCISQRSNGIPHGHYHVLLPRRFIRGRRLPNRIPLYPSLLQRNAELCSHQCPRSHHDHHPDCLLRE